MIARPLPGWFVALLIVEIVLAVLATVLVLGAGLLFTDSRTPGADYAILIAIGLAPSLVAVGVGAGARALWRRGEEGVAITLAVLPVLLGLPLLLVLMGFGL